jgi:redox-sensitive bicupin YhaK (pirin superfamily)
VDLYLTRLAPGETAAHALAPGRQAWAQVAAGETTLNGQRLGVGDGGAVSAESALRLAGVTEAEAPVFDLV